MNDLELKRGSFDEFHAAPLWDIAFSVVNVITVQGIGYKKEMNNRRS